MPVYWSQSLPLFLSLYISPSLSLSLSLSPAFSLSLSRSLARSLVRLFARSLPLFVPPSPFLSLSPRFPPLSGYLFPLPLSFKSSSPSSATFSLPTLPHPPAPLRPIVVASPSPLSLPPCPFPSPSSPRLLQVPSDRSRAPGPRCCSACGPSAPALTSPRHPAPLPSHSALPRRERGPGPPALRAAFPRAPPASGSRYAETRTPLLTCHAPRAPPARPQCPSPSPRPRPPPRLQHPSPPPPGEWA